MNCLAGQSSIAGAVECTACEAGKWSAEGDAVCTDCEAGKWSAEGDAECANCRAGQKRSAENTTGCVFLLKTSTDIAV